MRKEVVGGNRFIRFIQGLGITIGAMMSLLFFIIVLVIAIGIFVPTGDLVMGNVAVVPIKGTISTDGSGDLIEKKGTSSQDIVDWIKEADEDEGTKAILLEIDSPGGSPVATDEIARAVKEAEKLTVAVIRESGTSGAFWIATATDHVFANRMSRTGSIGVRGSRLEFAGLLADYNVTYRRLVAGKYKDAGSRWKEMTPEEQALYQNLLNDVHAEFVEEVANNRNIPIERVAELADGFVILGEKAKELGFVDSLGNKDDAIAYIEQELGIEAKTYEFKPSRTFFEQLVGVSSYHAGIGIGTVLVSSANSEKFDVTI